MSLAVALIVIVALVVILLGLLAFVMTRPSGLRPHRPSGARLRFLRARHRRAAADASPPTDPAR